MSKTTDYVIEVMNDMNSKEIEIQLEKIRLIKKAKGFWNTPYDELIEQGYGVEMIDPKDSYIFDLDNNLH